MCLTSFKRVVRIKLEEGAKPKFFSMMIKLFRQCQKYKYIFALGKIVDFGKEVKHYFANITNWSADEIGLDVINQ